MRPGHQRPGAVEGRGGGRQAARVPHGLPRQVRVVLRAWALLPCGRSGTKVHQARFSEREPVRRGTMIARQDMMMERADVWAKLSAPLPQGVIAWRQDGRPV